MWGMEHYYAPVPPEPRKPKPSPQPKFIPNQMASRPLWHNDPDHLAKLDMDLPALYPYQKEGVLGIEKFGGRCLLADDPGLGKTPQALRWAMNFLDKDEGPVIVVCPDFLKENWRRETWKFNNWNARILESRTPPVFNSLAGPSRIYIINYTVVQHHVDYIKSLKPALLIMDECQNVKSLGAKRTKACKELAKRCPYVLGLSGTPLTNRPSELWPILNMIRPDLYPSFFAFGQKFCKPRFFRGRMHYDGACRLDELHHELRHGLMIRRLKRDVLKDLPDKIKSVIPMSISHRNEYKEAEADFLNWLAKQSLVKAKRAANAEMLVRTGYLKRLAAVLKVDADIQWIENFLETHDTKLIVFGIHKMVLNPLYERFKDISVLVNGETAKNDKQRFQDRFNTDPACRIFFGNIESAGSGWSCPVSSDVAFVELDWRPALHIQAEDRVHGLKRGITGRVSNAHYLVAENTIEERLVRILHKKQQTINATLDGDPESQTLDILEQLLELMEQENYGRQTPKH